jgi:hypothetical protein
VSSSGKQAFQGDASLERAVLQIYEMTKLYRSQMAVCGGYSMRLYGSTRLTQDIDVIVDRAGPIPPSYSSRLSFGGFSLITSEGVTVNVIQRKDIYAKLYASALHRAKPVTLPLSRRKIRVVRPSDLMILKLVSARPKDELDLGFLVNTFGKKHVAEAKRLARTELGEYAADRFAMDAEAAAFLAKRG